MIILSGGPNSVHLKGAPTVPDGFFEYCEDKKLPILGWAVLVHPSFTPGSFHVFPRLTQG